MPTNLELVVLWKDAGKRGLSLYSRGVGFWWESGFCNLNDAQELSVQRQKNSAKRACNTLLVTMKQI